jgi:hypothetical protein
VASRYLLYGMIFIQSHFEKWAFTMNIDELVGEDDIAFFREHVSWIAPKPLSFACTTPAT